MADDTTATGTSWMSDVQRVLALVLICCLALATLGAAGRVIWIGEPDAVNDMAKTLLASIVNMGLIALGFFFGSTVQKGQADAGQQKIIEKLTSAGPPGGPVAPVEVVPTLDALAGVTLTDVEKAHFDKLPDDDAKKKFVAMTSEQRAQAIQRGV